MSKPSKSTLAVNTEIKTADRGKILLVSNITLFDDRKTYLGKVFISMSSSVISYKASGEIAMVQNSAGGWLEVLYRIEERTPFVGTLPLMGELEMDTPDDGQHQITLGTAPFDITCYGAKIPQVC